MKGETIGVLMTIMHKLKQLYPNHHHRVQPKPNMVFQTAEETIYQAHVRPKRVNKSPMPADQNSDVAWELVAEGLHKEVHAKLDELLQAQQPVQEAIRDKPTAWQPGSNWP